MSVAGADGGKQSPEEVSSSAADDDKLEASLLARAYPEGIRAPERAYLATLAPERRKIVLARLAAILDLEEAGQDGLDAGSIAAAAARAGSGRTAFHQLRVRWAAHRSLEALAPWGRRKGDGSRHGDGFDVARAKIRKSLLFLPGERNGSVARIVGGNLGDGAPSRPTLTRIVQEERRRMSTAPAFLRAAYGARLLVDFTAVSLALEDGTAIVVCLVVEEASLLILGHSIGTAARHPSASDAAREALLVLEEMCADRPSGRGDLLLIAPKGVSAKQVSALQEAGVTVRGDGARRFGQKLTSRMGAKFGRLTFRPGATVGGFNPKSPTRPPVRLDIGKADALVAREIERHNLPILPLLIRCRLAGPGVGSTSGSMALALKPLADF